MSRDPRFDPMPGDVLSRMDGPTQVLATVITAGKRVQYRLTDPLGKDRIYRIPLTCSMKIEQWRTWAATAKVRICAEGPTDGGSA